MGHYFPVWNFYANLNTLKIYFISPVGGLKPVFSISYEQWAPTWIKLWLFKIRNLCIWCFSCWIEIDGAQVGKSDVLFCQPKFNNTWIKLWWQSCGCLLVLPGLSGKPDQTTSTLSWWLSWWWGGFFCVKH